MLNQSQSPQDITKQPYKEFKLERVAYYALRGIVRLISMPVSMMPECMFKSCIRRSVLSIQHSLPTELAVNSGDTIVQIGTPWPRTLHRFRRAVGERGCLVIVEAEPINYNRLKSAVEEAGYKNVHVIEGAAWSETIAGKLATSPYFGDHKIQQKAVSMDNDLRAANKEMKQIDVQFYRLDTLLSELGVSEINYLCVTVNGAELEVLKGAEEILKRNQNIRVYAKGHARLENGLPLHTVTEPYMRSLGYSTKITRGEPSSTTDISWRWRAGDLYAWK